MGVFTWKDSSEGMRVAPRGSRGGKKPGAVRFALTSILSQGERKWPPSATHAPPRPSGMPPRNRLIGGYRHAGAIAGMEPAPCEVDWGRERFIPDRSPGHAFVAIAHAGWCRHTEV